MEKRIFESKGIPKKQELLLLVCSIVLAALGVICMFISQAKRTGISISTSFGSGRIGGGYMFTESGRKTLIILGIVSIAFGIIMICNLLTMKKSMFVIYEGHIEGVQYIPLFIVNLKRDFNLKYDQIIDVQVTQGSFGQALQIVTNGRNYGVILKDDGKEGIEYIRQKIKKTL